MKTTKRALKLSAVLAAVLLATGCASSSSPTVGGGDVVYGDSKAVETVTNEFGSTDLQMISEAMARSLMQHPSMASRPLLVVAEVKNKTTEYIDTRNITNSMKTQLMKSGAKFVTDSSTLDAQVEEIRRQTESGLYKNKVKVGQMKGAKYLLTGEITSIVKKNDSTKDVYYKFTLILKNIEEGVDEWQDEKEIRKTSKR